MGKCIILFVTALLLVAPSLCLSAEEKLYRATVESDGVQRVEVTGGSYFFNPNHIIVKMGVPVELKVRKESGFVPHNIVAKSPEAGVEFDESIDSDKAKVIRFTPTKAGTYPFFCSKKVPLLFFLASHREKGMEGTIEVVP
jgi:plastocyanin